MRIRCNWIVLEVRHNFNLITYIKMSLNINNYQNKFQGLTLGGSEVQLVRNSEKFKKFHLNLT